MNIIKPMLASAVENLSDIKYPILVTPKLDGIRCIIVNRKAVTRSFKPIPNRYICTALEATCPDGFDGELTLKGNKPFNEVSSAIMSEEGEPDFVYIVFDWYLPNQDYIQRMYDLEDYKKIPNTKYLIPLVARNEEELLDYETKCLIEGYEGVMIRSIHSPYKFGRSTIKEGYLLKLKRFTDGEATIVGFQEKMHNANEATHDAFGYTERSSHQANQVPMNTLGAFLVKETKTEVEFKIGTGDGLDDKLRKEVWDNRSKYLGKLIKYKSQKVGEKDAPRFPVFLGFRDRRDL